MLLIFSDLTQGGGGRGSVRDRLAGRLSQPGRAGRPQCGLARWAWGVQLCGTSASGSLCLWQWCGGMPSSPSRCHAALLGETLCSFSGCLVIKYQRKPPCLVLCALSGVNVNRTQRIYGFISQRRSQQREFEVIKSLFFSRGLDKSGGNHLILWGL